MQIEIKVPQLSESVTEATLLEWRRQPGEAVREGDNLIDVETDKVVLELPAPSSGVLVKIIKQGGEKVGSQEVIALLDTEAQASATPAAPAVAVPAVTLNDWGCDAGPSRQRRTATPSADVRVPAAVSTAPPPPIT